MSVKDLIAQLQAILDNNPYNPEMPDIPVRLVVRSKDSIGVLTSVRDNGDEVYLYGE